jgi:tetratricopeptide (TPR) repeat protein
MHYFAILLFLVSGLIADSNKPEKRPHCLDPEGNSVPADYFLSQALKLQASTLRPGSVPRSDLHKQALVQFDLYIQCMEDKGYQVNGNTYFQKAISQLELGDQGAGTTIDRALEVDNRHREAIILKSRLLIRNKEYNQARDILEDAISLFSNDSDLLYLLGSLNWELGNESRALLYFGSLWNNIQKREGDPRYRINVLKSIAEILAKRMEKDRSARMRAVFYLKTYLKYKPDDLESKFVLSLLLFYSGKVIESRNNLLEILDKKPGHGNAFEFLGEIYFLTNRALAIQYLKYAMDSGKIRKGSHLHYLYLVLQSRYTEATPYLEKSIQSNKNRLSSFVALMEIYRKTKEVNKFLEVAMQAAKLSYAYKDNIRAVQIIKEMIALGESNPGSKEPIAADYDFIASCYEDAGAYHLALIYLRKAIESSKDSEEKFRYKSHEAVLLRNQTLKRFEDSNKILKALNNEEPGSDGVYFDMGLNYYFLGKFRESVDYYSWAIDIAPKKSYYYFYRAMSYEKLGYIQETEVDLRRSIDLDPEFAQAYNFLGYMFAEKEIQLEESLKLIRKAIDLEPDNPAFQDSLGWVLFRFGKHEEALHHLTLADELMEDRKEKDAVIFDHLGDVYFHLNDLPKARENWKKALETDSMEVDKKKVQEKLDKLEKVQNQ